MWKSRRRLVFFQIDNAHKRQVTVILIEVKPEPKDKLIWNSEAPIMDRDNRLAPFGFIEQRTDPETAWLAEQQ